MDTDAVQLFAALLTIVVWLGTVAVLLAWALRGRGGFAREVHVAVSGAGLWLAWIVAFGAMAGSLYMSEVANYTPCNLCWYQRIPMYALAVILLIAGLRRDVAVRWYAIPLAAIGLVISVYHYFLEWFPQIETDVCSITVPCSTIWFREFGFVSLPFMAVSAFIFIIAVLVTRSTMTSSNATRDHA